MVDMAALCADLDAEQQELDAAVGSLDDTEWNLTTPSPGWRVRDQIAHLAYFDAMCALTVADPEAFALERQRADRDPDAYGRAAVDAGSGISGHDLLEWWRTERARMLALFRNLDPKARVPWYGPSMSATSKVTARIMETWAHGWDIGDTLSFHPAPTNRLRHVAHIGVGARSFSYTAHDKEMPDVPVRVELTAPSGELWSWGPADASNTVRGPALDFCLVITQRRHHLDRELEVAGDAAREWISIGQAFAGPPGTGRRPGQFRGD